MTLHFAGMGGAPATVAVAAVALAATAWLYRRVLTQPHGRVLLALRVLSVAAFLVFVARPAVSFGTAHLGDGPIDVLVDTSRSMSVRDAVGGADRLTAARAHIAALAPRLAELAPVERTLFDTSPRRASDADLAAARATGEGSDLGKALRSAVEATPRPAAIVLFTDGRETGAESAADVAAAAGVPIHVVAMGGTAAAGTLRDAAVARVDVDRETFVHSRVAVHVDLRSTGRGTTPATVEVRRGDDVVARQEVSLAPGRTETTLTFLPTEPGVFEYEVRLAPLPDETVTENDARWFPLEVTAERVRVLFYEGTPRWEYRYARRALAKDAGVTFTGLVRTNVDRVYQQGTAELRAFPTSREGLQPFHAIVLGDVGRHDLSAEQAAMLRAWVEDGGGLLVAGGTKLWGPDGLAGSALDAALPIVPAAGPVAPATGTFAVLPSREGLTHPAVLGLRSLPAVGRLFLAGPPKPGAEALLVAGGEAVLVAQRYGRGRVLLLATDDDWSWCTGAAGAAGEDAHARLWGQSVRWLVDRSPASQGGEGAARLVTDRQVYAPGEPVRISLQGGDADRVTVADADGPQEVRLEKGEGVFVPRRGGVHTATSGALRRSFVVERSPREMDEPTADLDLLRRVAAASHGSLSNEATVRDLPAAIVRAANASAAGAAGAGTVAAAAADEWTVDGSPWFFVAFVLLLGADWSVRKWLQLA